MDFESFNNPHGDGGGGRRDGSEGNRICEERSRRREGSWGNDVYHEVHREVHREVRHMSQVLQENHA